MNKNNGRCPKGDELHKEYMLFRSRVDEGWVFERPGLIAAWAKLADHVKDCEQCGVKKEELEKA